MSRPREAQLLLVTREELAALVDAAFRAGAVHEGSNPPLHKLAPAVRKFTEATLQKFGVKEM